ncbi:MAG: hypothetical protein ACK55I_34580, partial [bacterium]
TELDRLIDALGARAEPVPPQDMPELRGPIGNRPEVTQRLRVDHRHVGPAGDRQGTIRENEWQVPTPRRLQDPHDGVGPQADHVHRVPPATRKQRPPQRIHAEGPSRPRHLELAGDPLLEPVDDAKPPVILEGDKQSIAARRGGDRPERLAGV